MQLPESLLFNLALFSDNPYLLSTCDQQMRCLISSEGFWKAKFAREGLDLPLFASFGPFSWFTAYLNSKKSKQTASNFMEQFKSFTILLWYIHDVRMLSFSNLSPDLASSYLSKSYKEYEIKNSLQSFPRKFNRCFLKVEKEKVTFVLGEHKHKVKLNPEEMHRFLFHVDYLNIQKLAEL